MEAPPQDLTGLANACIQGFPGLQKLQLHVSCTYERDKDAIVTVQNEFMDGLSGLQAHGSLTTLAFGIGSQ